MMTRRAKLTSATKSAYLAIQAGAKLCASISHNYLRINKRISAYV